MQVGQRLQLLARFGEHLADHAVLGAQRVHQQTAAGADGQVRFNLAGLLGRRLAVGVDGISDFGKAVHKRSLSVLISRGVMSRPVLDTLLSSVRSSFLARKISVATLLRFNPMVAAISS